MNFLTIKFGAQKAFVWLKNHWYVPLTFTVAVVSWFFYRQKGQAMVDNLKESRKAHKEEVKILESLQEQERNFNDGAISSFVEGNKRREESLKRSLEDLETQKEQRQEELVDKDLSDIAKAISDSLKE